MGVPVTSVGPCTHGTSTTQIITFSTRYAYDSANGNSFPGPVFQGGISDMAYSIVPSAYVSSWPVAYRVLGATSATSISVANCDTFSCYAYGAGWFSSGTPVTFFRSTEVIGTAGGSRNQVELASNAIPFANGDSVVSAPSSLIQMTGSQLIFAQRSPSLNNLGNGALNSTGYHIADLKGLCARHDGSCYLGAAFSSQNDGDNSNSAQAVFQANGSYTSFLDLFRPPLTSVLAVHGNYFTGQQTNFLNIFTYYPGFGNYGGFSYDPNSGYFGFSGGVASSNLQASNANLNNVIGPSVAPAGSCPTNGAWEFSQDGHATVCLSGTWQTKI